MALASSLVHCRACFLLTTRLLHLGLGEQCQAHDALHLLSYLAPGGGKEWPNSGSDQPVYFLSPKIQWELKISPSSQIPYGIPGTSLAPQNAQASKCKENTAPWEEGLTPMRYRMMMATWWDDESNACRKPLLTFANNMNGVVEYCIPGLGDFLFLVTLRTVMQLPMFYIARQIYKPPPAIITVILYRRKLYEKCRKDIISS